MSDEWAAEPVPEGRPPSRDTASRWARAVFVVAVAAALGFLGGSVTTAGTLPTYDCGERVLALIEVERLPDQPVEVLAPLRSADPTPLPLETVMTTELVGSSVGHQEFRPAQGKLALTVELPADAIGRTAQVIGDSDPRVLTRVPIVSPLCKSKPVGKRD